MKKRGAALNANRTLRILLLILLAGSAGLWAGNTGKIAGVAKDKQTGEALIGVNILLKGTTLGAATDQDGYFFILQVPPGSYELEANYIGYHTITITGVRVNVDLTTRVDIKMESTTIEGSPVTVEAEQSLIQKDITATRRTTTREEILTTPGLDQTVDVFRLQGGTFLSPGGQSITGGEFGNLEVRDESLQEVHVRGGRGGEILYMVDGVPVTHPLYGGREVLNLNLVDVEHVELLTGAFNAEYGQAQSGVINITTRTGGDKFTGGIEYKSDKIGGGSFSSSFDDQYTSFYLGGPEPLTGKLLPGIGLDLPGSMSFFLSGNGNLSNTEYNNNRTRQDFSVLGFDVTERQDNTGNFNAKLTWNLTNTLKTEFNYNGSWNRWSRFDWGWRDYPDHMIDYQRNTQNFIFRINHTLSRSTFYNVNFGYMTVNYRASLNGLRPVDFWRFATISGGDTTIYSPDQFEEFKQAAAGLPRDSILTIPLVSGPQENPVTKFNDFRSFETHWRDDFTRSFTFKGDITSQIHPEHLVKTGVEVRYHDLRYIDIQDGGLKTSYYFDSVLDPRNQPAPLPPGPFPEFGKTRWAFDAFPFNVGAYIQDKFEKETLILNVGARLDWFNTGPTVNTAEWRQVWEDATGLKADWKQDQFKISPRFGVSFPISDRTVTFFSYGHFNQLPELQFYYRDPYSGNLIGNPGLDFEQTVLYEFGFTHQLSTDWAFDIKSYAKDISQQINTTSLITDFIAAGQTVYVYDNKDNARARGLEFQAIKRHSNYTSGKLTYTVQWANGFSSSAFEGYIRSLNDFPNPIRERRLSWDIRHQIIFQGSLAAGKNEHPRLFGLRLPDQWYITMLANFFSGSPYTAYTTDPAVRQVTENLESGPVRSTMDLKIGKMFNLANIQWTLFADVFNLLDERNNQIDYGFNSETGKPYIYGDLEEGTNKYYDYSRMVRLMDPRQFAQGRQIKLGMRLDW